MVSGREERAISSTQLTLSLIRNRLAQHTEEWSPTLHTSRNRRLVLLWLLESLFTTFPVSS